MLIAAADCVRAGGNDKWLAANYEGIRGWAESMLATDTDGNGLFKYSVSGNSGIWPDGFPMVRPSNWWDTIGFGHEDAYGNALAFRALRGPGRDGREARQVRRCSALSGCGRKTAPRLLRAFLRSRDRRSRRLAQRGRQTPRLLLSLGQRHRHPLRAGGEAASQRHHGQATRQDERSWLRKIQYGIARQPDHRCT